MSQSIWSRLKIFRPAIGKNALRENKGRSQILTFLVSIVSNLDGCLDTTGETRAWAGLMTICALSVSYAATANAYALEMLQQGVCAAQKTDTPEQTIRKSAADTSRTARMLFKGVLLRSDAEKPRLICRCTGSRTAVAFVWPCRMSYSLPRKQKSLGGYLGRREQSGMFVPVEQAAKFDSRSDTRFSLFGKLPCI